MLKRKLGALLIALSAITGATAVAAAYVDTHQQAPASVQAADCNDSCWD